MIVIMMMMVMMMITYELLWATSSVSDGVGRDQLPLPTFFSILVMVMINIIIYSLANIDHPMFLNIDHLIVMINIIYSLANFLSILIIR